MSLSTTSAAYSTEQADFVFLRGVGPSLPLGVLIGVLLISVGAAASAQETAPSAAPLQPETLSPQDAYLSALKELERLEAMDAGEMTATSLEELNKRLIDLQAKDSTHPRIAYLYGRAYALGGRGKDAIEQLRRFVETREGRTDWEAYRRLGDLFVDEFPQLAKGSYQRAAELKSHEPTILVGLSLSAYRVGQVDEAVRLAKEALDADGGKTVRVASHLARMLVAKRDWVEAERAATRATELAEAEVKSRPGARGALKTLDLQCALMVDLIQGRIADRAVGTEDYLRLVEVFRRRNELAAKLNSHECARILEGGVNGTAPDTPPKLLQEYAMMLAEVGRTNDARKAFEKLLSVEPQNATALQWLEKLGAAPKDPPR